MKLGTIKHFFFTLSFFIFTISKVYAQVAFDGKNDMLTIGKKIEYYIDSSSNKNVQFLQQQKQFIRSKSNVPDFGLLKVPIWLKVSVTNNSNTPEILIEFGQSFLQSIDFYSWEDGRLTVSKSGELYPFSSRTIKYHQFIYALHIPRGATATYYFRIVSNHAMQLPVFLGNKDHVEENNLTKNILFGVFFGIIIVMFFYNLFIYFVVKDSIYLYYVVYILIVGLIQVTIEGYSFHYLWPDNRFLATRSFFILTALVNISGLAFVRQFLQTKRFIPRLDKISYLIYFVYAVAIILACSGEYYISYQILQSFAGIVSVYIIVIASKIAWYGYRPAKFFLIAWIPLIVGILIWILKDFGVFPYNTFTNYSITLGSALEVVLLSFALADKINILKAENDKSQLGTLQALKENERIIREQNVVLEKNVIERTSELISANTVLNETLEDLKQTQSQLVESEKMASLGQLTAGIAHEINNPINFVTSNIRPLRRDIDILTTAFNTIEAICLSDVLPADRQKQILDYKEEIEFDILTLEISHLVKGISEGANRTAEIVKGLKIFSRLDEDDLKKADINEGLKSTMIIANNLLNNNIKTIKNYSDLPLVECYAGKLNQVFLNIISNAVYAVKIQFDDRPGGEITIETSHDETFVFVTFKDNGIGMDEKTRQKIFEPFFTTKNVGEGTGLGMSISYNTIKKHNGKIVVQSTPHKGSIFRLEIPIKFDTKHFSGVN
ncbi:MULTISPECIES: 7TM diverse intracellular signaling domain-containing protein [unclassified Mucilaginibacter]|uniref:sensor histidine kinase n=1 Tax=unclassified Mucilaginibacter TaxID=2617802 RepID=UPI002AC90522|nr:MULTISPECIES: 7TM diverse intracellular signaling domain-containing protein [unclassified Mucilaginibacter]MEB0261221.1 7TM diverse intracellular signaling domain-containing protein [Mucilaginibacter sp. 10I4]MEB0280394.1 7TM diverse intracellular signaling domain-containing protein [Mucilaginibacter sp. 10B2]MEB0300415.1 7TM diverse intracellular signaling domain-containing protein [Mucilaginibacter sp. 5C4]WPX24516.1 7TM diverse intracellular signaling domain-containing protein [Mucilagini